MIAITTDYFEDEQSFIKTWNVLPYNDYPLHLEEHDCCSGENIFTLSCNNKKRKMSFDEGGRCVHGYYVTMLEIK